MWQCTRCREMVENNFDVCWNCGTSKDGQEDQAFRRAEDVPAEQMPASNIEMPLPQPPRPISVRKWGPTACPTCGQQCLYVKEDVPAGTAQGPSLLPGLGGLFFYATFDIVICAFCGHTRFFASDDARNKLPGSNWTKL